MLTGLISRIGIFDYQRNLINNNLKMIGMQPIPDNIYLYPDVKEYLESLKKRFERALENINLQKLSFTEDEIEKIKIAIKNINDNINEVSKDLKCLQIYDDSREINKDNANTFIMTGLLFDDSGLSDSISNDEKRIFSKFIGIILDIKMNDSGAYLKIYDYSGLKTTVKDWWTALKKSNYTADLVKRSIFRTYETIDSVLKSDNSFEDQHKKPTA